MALDDLYKSLLKEVDKRTNDEVISTAKEISLRIKGFAGIKKEP